MQYSNYSSGTEFLETIFVIPQKEMTKLHQKDKPHRLFRYLSEEEFGYIPGNENGSKKNDKLEIENILILNLTHD